MKPDDNINRLFDNLKDQWNFEEPLKGHEDRFLEKLQTQKQTISKKSNLSMWKVFSVAASLAILVAVGIQFFQVNTPEGVKNTQTDKSIEMEKTEFYFTSLINQEIEKIKEISTPETQQLVTDALKQMKKLETDYKKLETDMANNGNTKQILNAMIINFQTRISLLQDVLDQISKIKQLKTSNNESQTI